MNKEQLQILQWLVDHAIDTEWMTAHAAEDQYCPYCCKPDDNWRSMSEHHEGCKYKEMIAKAMDMKFTLIKEHIEQKT